LGLPLTPNTEAMIDRTVRPGPWPDAGDVAGPEPVKALTRDEARALREKSPSVSPWRIVLVQGGVGAAAAILGWLMSGVDTVALSVLYGAAAAVVPAALMARGMSSRLFGMSAQGRVANFVLWQLAKMGLAVAMLLSAPWVLSVPSWPALLVGLVLCLKVYWVALVWRGR
jgi:ATP synthase protein I